MDPCYIYHAFHLSHQFSFKFDIRVECASVCITEEHVTSWRLKTSSGTLFSACDVS